MKHVSPMTLEVQNNLSEDAQPQSIPQQKHTTLVAPNTKQGQPMTGLQVTSIEQERAHSEQTNMAPHHQHRGTPTPEPVAPTPTIQVTIGRIEVRAITPPTSSARPQPPRPNTGPSLDDYLSQYNGGKR